MRKQKGFTLIELLVVIAILGVLSTLAVVSLQNAREKSRDAKRLSDIKQMQTGLELYFNDEGRYPASITPGDALESTGGDVTYLSAVPNNPTPTNDGNCDVDTDYTYETDNSGSTYGISYCLGGKTGSVLAGKHTATQASICDDGESEDKCYTEEEPAP